MRSWLARFIELATQHHADAYKQGLEDARNIVEHIAMRRTVSPTMDSRTLEEWRDCANYIAERINDLLASRSGREQGGIDPVAASQHWGER